MSENESAAAAMAGEATRKWRTIAARDRRVLGVLVEKAKTTPEAYPMTLNGICTACNQKNNRFPQMELTPDDLEPVFDRLKGMQAIAEIQGSGRVSKYRHLLYDWLGVDKVELAVMAELLLRGVQTEGELRGRAARMEPIADVAALRPILDSLRRKDLIVSLSSEGRGQLVTHNLYEPREMEKLRSEHGAMRASEPTIRAAVVDDYSRATGRSIPSPADEANSAPRNHTAPMSRSDSASGSPAATFSLEPLHRELTSQRSELTSLRGEVASLRSEVDTLSEQLRQSLDEVRRLRDSLGG